MPSPQRPLRQEGRDDRDSWDGQSATRDSDIFDGEDVASRLSRWQSVLKSSR